MQAFEYLLFCVIVIHIVAVTSESGRRNHSTAIYVLDIGVLCFYLYAALLSLNEPFKTLCAIG